MSAYSSIRQRWCHSQEFYVIEHVVCFQRGVVATTDAGRVSRYSIYGKFVAADGSPVGLQATLLSPSASWQIATSTAFDGENYLVLWEDWRDGPSNGYRSDLYAARMTPEGFVLDDPAFLIADRPNREMMPQMIFGGPQYFVVFEYGGSDSQTIRGARILPDGTVLNPDGFDIAHSHPNGSVIRPQVAFNGRKYLVIWYNNYGTSGTTGVMGALVDTDGTVTSPTPIGIATQGFVGNVDFDVESNGDEFLVSWTVVNNNNSMSIKTTRVSDSGQILGTATLESSPFTIGYSRIAFNGESYFVTWKQGIGANVTAYGTRVGMDGQPIGNVMTVATGTHGYWDVVAHHGTFVLPYVVDAGEASGLYVTQVDADGSMLVDRRRVQDVPFLDLYGDASIASGPWDSLFVTSPLWADMPFNAPRIWKIPVALNGTAVAGDSDTDGDADLEDFTAFLDCVTSPGGGLPPGCDVFDFDGDDDTDFADLQTFQLVFTGSP